MNPKRIAIFVEGKTELIFIKKLLEEIAGENNISITSDVTTGKPEQPRKLYNQPRENAPFSALLYDSGNDRQVLSDMFKLYKKSTDPSTEHKYDTIIGVRDLYPRNLEKKLEFENSIKALIKGRIKSLKSSNTHIIPMKVIVAVMEVEAWFLAEWQFFSKIDERLTSEFILQTYGLDLINIDVETIPHPSYNLHQIYQLIGLNYTKTEEQVKEIVESINYQPLLSDVVKKVKQLQKLIKEIDDFLS